MSLNLALTTKASLCPVLLVYVLETAGRLCLQCIDIFWQIRALLQDSSRHPQWKMWGIVAQKGEREGGKEERERQKKSGKEWNLLFRCEFLLSSK
jgi:hypothetical protein